MATKLVLGANRGIGLAVVEQLCAAGETVVATCRSERGGLDQTAARVIEEIDLSEEQSRQRLVSELRDSPPDWVLFNAGVLSVEQLGTLDEAAEANIRRQFEINALAPLMTIQALCPLLAVGSRIGILTSRMGSMADNGSGGYYGYRMSKAAVNAMGRSLAMDLRDQGVAVALLHPGFVRTQMTGNRGDIDPAQAASGLIARMAALEIANSGRFWHANGEELPW